MMKTKSNSKPNNFNALARVLHWAMAFCIILMLFVGVGMVVSTSWRHWLLDLHRPLGISILLLAVVRLLNRLCFKIPELPSSIPKWQVFIAHASHWVLYGLMLTLPLLGWATLSAGDWPITLIGSWSLPPIAPVNPEFYAWFRAAHGLLAWVLFAFVLGHLAAALMHAWVFRDSVFSSMTRGESKGDS